MRGEYPVPFFDQGIVVQIFVFAETPPFTDLLVSVLGHCLGKPVPQSLRHDRIIIIVFILKLLGECIYTFPCVDRKGTDVVGFSTVEGSHESERQN